jgi:hypothetical protein
MEAEGTTREPQAHRAREMAYQTERSDDNSPTPRPVKMAAAGA